METPYETLFARLSREPEALLQEVRKPVVWAYSWAVPNEEAIGALAELSPLVELGAGTGYWAWRISRAGGRVRALDREPRQPPGWIELSEGTEDSIAEAAERTLLLCWPPLDSPMAERALRRFRGDRLAYVGEWRGRTADSAFHDLCEREWELERELEIPNWPGFRDRLYLMRRKSR